jgi:hypothetical protein
MILSAFFVLGCGTVTEPNASTRPAFIQVTGGIAGSDDTGSQGGSVLPFSNQDRTVTVSGEILDQNAEPLAYDGWVEVFVRPGTIKSVSGSTAVTDDWGRERHFVQAEAGTASATLTFSSSFGDTRIWMAATGAPEDGGVGGSYATGVTESIKIERPTIAQMQDVSDLEGEDTFATSPLVGEFVTVRTDDRDVVVTALTTKGFWASDLDDAPGNYSGMFVYTFNKPENVRVGDRLGLLGGGVQEYVGATQLSFPLYEAMEGQTLTPPAASELSDDVLCANDRTNNAALEPFESSLVTVVAGTIPEDFKETPPGIDSDQDYAQFLEYGQWPIELPGGCRVYVVSNATAPEFDPVAHAGETVGPITGLLSYVRAGGHKWMLLARGPEDLGLEPSGRDESPEGPTWPLPMHQTHGAQLCEHDHIGDHMSPRKD